MPKVTTQKLYDKMLEVEKLVLQLAKPIPPTPPSASGLYVPETQASRWVKENPLDINFSLIKKIADQPTAEWLGEWNGNVFDSVKSHMDKAGDKMPIFITYNIPGRDNGNYSKGGLHSPQEYYSWIGSIGAAIGDKKAIAIVEPDAVALSTDRVKITEEKAKERLEMIRIAVDILRKQPLVRIYLDASMWKTPKEMADLLKPAGIDKADGFSLNVSGYQLTTVCEKYGNELRAIVSRHFIIDTSRNGNGEWQTNEKDPWCNPPNRKIGNLPDLSKGYLWLKRPGESDGTCRGGPNAGEFWLEKAIELVK